MAIRDLEWIIEIHARPTSDLAHLRSPNPLCFGREVGAATRSNYHFT